MIVAHFKQDFDKIRAASVDELSKIDGIGETPLETMEAIAVKRGFILPGKRIDYERAARTILDEFRSAAIGRITLERPEV